MAGCSGCERRRKMIKEGYEKGGVKGAVKAVPAVVRDIIKGGEPNIRGKNGRRE